MSSVILLTVSMTEEKLVGLDSPTVLMDLVYASTTPSMPSTSGSKMLPFTAKQ